MASSAARPIRSLALLCGLLLLALLLGGCGDYTFNGTIYDPVIPAPEIAGTNWDGSPFSMGDVEGKVALLFFGYTACPDICPLALADMKQVKQQLGAQADEAAFIYVSVDPERDTPERLAAYVPAFDPAFYGVHVPLDALDAVKTGYGVFAEKRVLDADQSAVGYLIDHTGWTYLIDKQGNLRAVYDTEAVVEEIVEDVRHLARN